MKKSRVFKVGDQVKVLNGAPSIRSKDLVAVIVEIHESGHNLLLQFPENVGGHDGGDIKHTPYGHYWFVYAHNLQYVGEPTFTVVTTKTFQNHHAGVAEKIATMTGQTMQVLSDD